VPDGFAAAAQRLRDVERRLMPDVADELEVAARELVSDAKLSARTTLPRRGGYAKQVADGTDFEVRVFRTARGSVTVSITAVGPDYRLDKDGRLRHPVYARGPRTDWNWAREPQRVRPGWFTRPMREGRPRVRAQLVAAVTRTTRRAVGR
jgi:hypothetical protein